MLGIILVNAQNCKNQAVGAEKVPENASIVEVGIFCKKKILVEDRWKGMSRWIFLLDTHIK
jgi:hypothetical protein